ncbi:RNI-like protein [Ceratobasidium sp. AG-I]|nr:RNI-like protein [Ceratobasidium sp. AG-I]
MPKRRATSSTGSVAGGSNTRSKRIKFDNFAAPKDTDDLPPAHIADAQQQEHQSGSSGISTRSSPRVPATFPSLASLSARVFAANFKTLYIPKDHTNPKHGVAMRKSLKMLPDTIIPKLLALLREHCPTYLNHGLLVMYFLRGREICLTGDLPDVNVKVLHAIGTRLEGGIITSLELSRLPKINDQVFASVVSRLPELERLILRYGLRWQTDVCSIRGSSKAGPLVLEAVASKCPQLQVLNMNYTVVTPQSLMSVLFGCSNLEVLKIAGIPKLIAGSVSTIIKTYVSEHEAELTDKDLTYPVLRTLKLRHNVLTDADLNAFIPLCPNLTNLDISFTPIKHIPISTKPPSAVPPLKKLSLTATRVPGTELVQVLSRLPDLETLHLGALGEYVPSTSKGAGAGSGAGTITDDVLWKVTDALEQCVNLKTLHLMGNLKIGFGGGTWRAAGDFIRRVGRRCEVLNLENVPQLRSDDLEGLLVTSDNEAPSPLRVLNLARTNVNGDSAMYIAACRELEVLDLESTKFSSTLSTHQFSKWWSLIFLL